MLEAAGVRTRPHPKSREVRMKHTAPWITRAFALLLTGCAHSPDKPQETRMVSLAEQGYFFVGERYTKTGDSQIMTGQMYVQYQIPQSRTQAYPVVMWHGGGQTGTNFMGTPDGRKGWGEYFLQRG